MTTQSTRTFVAALIGVALLRLVAAIPVIADVLAYIDGIFAQAGYAGISTLKLVEVAITAAAILLYQKAAQWIGDRWPKIEVYLLGSAARPHYEPRYGDR